VIFVCHEVTNLKWIRKKLFREFVALPHCAWAVRWKTPDRRRGSPLHCACLVFSPDKIGAVRWKTPDRRREISWICGSPHCACQVFSPDKIKDLTGAVIIKTLAKLPFSTRLIYTKLIFFCHLSKNWKSSFFFFWNNSSSRKTAAFFSII